MKCRFTKHVLNMMSRRKINKETVLKTVQFYEKKWASKKNSRHEIFALDLIRVIRNKHNGCIMTVYEYGIREEWHK